jgi:hypothetical protein
MLVHVLRLMCGTVVGSSLVVEGRAAQISSVINLAFDNVELFFVLDSILLYIIGSTLSYVLVSTLHGILEGVCRLIQATHCTKQR